EELHTIAFLEPLDRRNRAALGYDMYSEPVRREAMARARDTGAPAASGQVILVQEIEPEKQAGFLLYVPVYDGATPATVEERRRRLRGFVYSPFRMGDLLDGVFAAGERPLVAFEVHDVGNALDQPVYRSWPEGGRPPLGELHAEASLEIAGRTWQLRFRSLPEFHQTTGVRFVPYVLGVGVFLSVLVG